MAWRGKKPAKTNGRPRAQSHKQSERTHHTAFLLFFLNNRSYPIRRIDCEEERKWLEESRRSKPRGKTQKGIRNLRDLSLKPELLLSRLPAPSVRLSLLYSLLFLFFRIIRHFYFFNLICFFLIVGMIINREINSWKILGSFPLFLCRLRLWVSFSIWCVFR